MDDLFSLFISLGKCSREDGSLADTFKAIQLFSTQHGLVIKNPLQDREDRIIFDLLNTQQPPVSRCDIQYVAHAGESIVIFGGNEWELRQAHLFDENNVHCFIAQLAVFLFVQGVYDIGLVATEDTFTTVALHEFHPGHWTLFRSDRLPAFVAGLPWVWAHKEARVYQYKQLATAPYTAEHMGRDIRSTLHVRSS